MMDVQATEAELAPAVAPAVAPLTATASAMQRLDDKLATGMKITDVAKCRWLTSVEVLQFMDNAVACNYRDYPLMTGPPTTPPKTGRLVLYNGKDTPDYANDGIEWVADPGVKWKSIEKVLAQYAQSDDEGDDGDSESGSALSEEDPPPVVKSHQRGGSTGAPLALMTGASAEYLSCATRNTFHRREYRGPNNIVLLHYLDSVRALRVTSELVDRIVVLSADYVAKDLPPVPVTTGVKAKVKVKDPSEVNQDLGDAMNVLMNMVDEHDAAGTAMAEAVDEHVLKAATSAAYSAVMKHVAPEEAVGVVEAMEMVMEDALLEEGGDNPNSGEESEEEQIMQIQGVTELDIDEAINQVLQGEAPQSDDDGMMNDEPEPPEETGSSESSDTPSQKENKAKKIEDRILDSIEEVLPDELKAKLINTTERVLDAKGVKLSKSKGIVKKDPMPMPGMMPGGAPKPPPAIGSPESFRELASSPGTSPGEGHAPLPEIVDVTPDFHTNGYQPGAAYHNASSFASGGHSSMRNRRSASPQRQQQMHELSVVISTKTPIPTLPPYVDQYYVWERFAAFVDFQEAGDDPLVRNISFNRMTPLNSSSYKVKMPMDIPNFSIRHIIVVGVLLPKDHRVKRNLHGIELALKLTLQTEWMAAADLVGSYYYSSGRKGEDGAPLIKGIKRPVFMAPCGGNRMQLLTQISKTKFTMYPATTLPTVPSILPGAAANFVQRVAITAKMGTEAGQETKRKRENYLEEYVATPGIDARMTTKEVDLQRKVRFVERITRFASEKGESEVLPDLEVGNEVKVDGMPVEEMDEEEVDDLLGRVLMRYVEVCIGRCATREELMGEFNWSGYSGLTLLHHACFYNFMALITLLINNGADTNILSAEGDLTPLHFAAAAGYKDVVDVLIRNGCNPSPIDCTGETPADHARKAGHAEIAAMLSAYNEQAGILAREDAMEMNNPSKTTDVFLQSAFKELSLKDKLGLNLFVDRSKAAPLAFVCSQTSKTMITDGDGEELENAAFSFISEDDRARLREAMSLASEMDLKEMNLKAEHQDVRRYLRQSNYEAISAASQALEKANRKEKAILESASSSSDDPSKMQLSRALAMLVLRKNLSGT